VGFISKFNRNYASQEEHDHRFSLFQSNCQELKQIIQNSQGSTATFGFTKFMDWSQDEKAKIATGFANPDNSPAPAAQASRAKRQTQATFDWRNSNNVSPIRDQGNCGSCVAFACTAGVESQMLINNHSNYALLGIIMLSYPDQSEQELVSCVSGNSCAGGNVNRALNYLQANGQDTESTYPYTATNSACNAVATGKTKITRYWNIGSSESNIANNLPSTGPLINAVWVPNSIYYYTSGIYQPAAGECATGQSQGLGHVFSVIGYNVTDPNNSYWIFKNSWGTGWGQSGYGYWKFGNWFRGCSQIQAMTAVSTI